MTGRTRAAAVAACAAWAGYNLSAGEEWLFELTPMLGIIFGNTTGVTPGFKGSLSCRNLPVPSGAAQLPPASRSSSTKRSTASSRPSRG